MIIFAFAEGATWYNYPGLELWKFFNLALFTAVAIYILRRPISAALATRREAIKQAGRRSSRCIGALTA